MKWHSPSPLGPRLTTALVAGMGMIILISAVTPGLPDRVAWMEEIVPMEIRHSAHLFTALSGFSLLILASGLLLRKRMAWVLTLAFLIDSILFDLVQGWTARSAAPGGCLAHPETVVQQLQEQGADVL